MLQINWQPDQTVRLWEAESGKLLATFQDHDNRTYGEEFSPDGRRMLTASDDGTARLWEADSGRPLAGLTFQTLNLSSCGSSLPRVELQGFLCRWGTASLGFRGTDVRSAPNRPETAHGCPARKDDHAQPCFCWIWRSTSGHGIGGSCSTDRNPSSMARSSSF